MWIKASGEITDHILQLTTASSSHLLIVDEYSAIGDAGLAADGEAIWERVEQEAETLDFILLTHAHFDHIGTIPYLRSKAPHLRLITGRLTSELLNDTSFTKELYEKNKEASFTLGHKLNIKFEDFHKALQSDLILNDGENISLGDTVDIILIDTPGHSVDSVSYYIKPDGALIAGDTIGHYGGRDLVTPAFRSSFNDYISSIQKLSTYDIQVLALPHGGSLTGEIITKFITELLIYSNQYKDIFSKRIKAGENIEELAKATSIEWIEEGRFPDGPFKYTHLETIIEMLKASV